MNKQMSLAELVAAIKPGSSLAMGGGGVQRKPMAFARALGASNVDDLDLISFLGGPETDLLLGLGRVRRLSFAFVGFDAYGLAPNFRQVREAGTIEAVEYSEAITLTAFEAAAKRLPFLPTRFGLGTDILNTPTCPFKTFICPISGDTLLAVPALAPDVAVIHVNEADRAGNAIIHGDAYADPLLARAARRTYLTAERVVDRLPADHSRRSTFLSRMWIAGVVEAPKGAGFTGQYPEYPLDLPALLTYQARATDPVWLADYAAGRVS